MTPHKTKTSTLIPLVILCCMGWALLFTSTSCKRIKKEMKELIINGGKEIDAQISSLYPELADTACVGMKCDNGFSYQYWFRYKATPSTVETALMTHICEYVEIEPDITLIPCNREYAIDHFQLRESTDFNHFAEWKNAPENHLVYYHCTRTPLHHVLVFDTIEGYAYHYISEFRE
ncbi:MAG: hypothetical protein IK017_02730 [Paludibacteraceae bacterium]|nr:hypothetical protein [Paludibacteraceae bacterium]